MFSKLKISILILFIVIILLHLAIVVPGALRIMQGKKGGDHKAENTPSEGLPGVEEIETMGFTRIVCLEALGKLVETQLDVWGYNDVMNFAATEEGFKNAELFMFLVNSSLAVALVSLILLFTGHGMLLAIGAIICALVYVATVAFYFCVVLGEYGVFIPYSLTFNGKCIGMFIYLTATAFSVLNAILSVLLWRSGGGAGSEYYPKSTAGSTYRSYPKMYGK